MSDLSTLAGGATGPFGDGGAAGPARRPRTLVDRIVANRTLMQLVTAMTLLAVLIYGTATFPLESHVVLSLIAVATALVITRLYPQYRLVSVILSIAISLRYIIWRGLETLNLNDGPLNATVSVILYAAEVYTVFVLVGGYFQTSIFLDRKPVAIPTDPDKLPTVDVMIPSYNESVEIVRRTLVAAVAMDYPKKIVYLLDDGRRPEMKELAAECGAQYLTRPDNKHAKAGNINHAMEHTDGELIAFFDADHSPTASFLLLTVGFFLENKNLGLAQTPHHFYNPDPFHRNLYVARQVPPEQNLFYHLIQVSNDFWNSAFFCGSCAVMRRSALEGVGGVAVETVTEDAHTAMKVQADGWDTAYLNIPQAAGLATERFSDYVGQRIRWARGMAQILRMDPPFLKRGLTWYQRVNYTYAATHFFFGLPRLVFLVSPMTYLIFGLNPLGEDIRIVMLYAMPHLALAYINASAAHRNQRHTFWPEVYETAIAPYTALVTTLALMFPKRARFNVTPKGAQVDATTFNWRAVWFNLFLFMVGVAAVPFAILRGMHSPPEKLTLLIVMIWNLYNLALLGAAIAVAIERPQRRQSHRIPVSYPLIAVEAPDVTTMENGDHPDSEIEELSEDSYAPVEGVDPVHVFRDTQHDLGRAVETSEVSFGSQDRPVPSLMPSDNALPEGTWRATGQSIDVSEGGVRFLLGRGSEVPRFLNVTILSDRGDRVTVPAEALGAWATDKGTVVRGRFLHVANGQMQSLIRLMFSNPNAWTGDVYASDNPVSAFVNVITAPVRAVAYWLGLLRPPPEYTDEPDDAETVNRPVITCFHCGGVLLRPMPVCPHCTEPLANVPEAEDARVAWESFQMAAQSRGGVTAYLWPGLLLTLAVIVAVSSDRLWPTPNPDTSTAAGLDQKYDLSAEDGADLAADLEKAIHANQGVRGEWGAQISSMRATYPRAQDPVEHIYSGPKVDVLANNLFRLHEIESEYRRAVQEHRTPPSGLTSEVQRIRAELDKLRD